MTNMLEYARVALYFALVVIIVFLYQAWEKEHAITLPVATTTSATPIPAVFNKPIPLANEATTATPTPALLSTPPSTPTAAAPAASGAATDPNRVIHITTDVLKVDIDKLGGQIIGVRLLDYPQTLHSTIPYTLLNNDPTTRYIARSALIGANGPDMDSAQAVYDTSANSYQMTGDQDTLNVTLNWKNTQGLKVSKIFSFHRGEYEIGVNYQLINGTPQPWSGTLYFELGRTNTPTETKTMIASTYFGAAISSPDKPFEKITFKQMSDQSLNRMVENGWAAMVQHYFVSAWVPPRDTSFHYFSQVSPENLYTIGAVGPTVNVQPGATSNYAVKFYSGPEIADLLKPVAPGLQLTIDYGWLWMISEVIFWLMQHIYHIVGNWGVSIILVTVLIKLLFFHLSAKSYRSMRAMKNLQPRIEALKERYADSKQQFSQAMFDLYKKEKVNPMGGCLPLVVQIPVFIALYWVLIESVQLRQAPFIFWIQDLSVKDPFYVLPAIMGVTMFLQQLLSPPPPDPTQAKIFLMMPFVFTFMFLNLPAGLMLYWVVNNGLSILQQWYIMRTSK